MNCEFIGWLCIGGAIFFGAVAGFAGWRMNAWRRAERMVRSAKVRSLLEAIARQGLIS